MKSEKLGIAQQKIEKANEAGIKIIATKGLSACSVSTKSIFSGSKSPRSKSNDNFHFSHLLSGELTTIYRKHEKFKNSIY